MALGLPNSSAGKKLAHAKALDIQRDIAFGQFDPTLEKYRTNATPPCHLSTPALFEKFIEYRRLDGTSGQTITAKYRPMLNHIKRFAMNITTDTHARNFVAILRDRQSPRTANESLSMLRSFGIWCIEQEYLDLNPYKKIKPLKDSGEPVQNREAFTLDEIKKIFEAIKEHPKSSPYYEFSLFLMSLGVRPSECIGLRWQHINFDKKQVTIKESLSRGPDGQSAGHARERKKTKSVNIRTLPLSPLLLQILDNRWSIDSEPDELIFTTPEGKPIDDCMFRQSIWKPACTRAGVTYRPPYTSRHTLLSHGIETMGWTLPQAAKIAGHANTLQIAQTYGQALSTPKFPEFQEPPE